MASAEPTRKHNILVLGGLGFIGRNFLHYITENDLAAKIRVVDKIVPEMAFFSCKNSVDFKKHNIEFIQANLLHPDSVARVFESEPVFDVIFNLAGETKRGQSHEIYEEGIFKVSINCAKQASGIGATFVEISSGEMLSRENHPIKETSEPDPWTTIAKYKYKVEETLKEIPGLKYIIIRPAMVYGPTDTHNLTPRLIIASIYRFLGQKMKVLWNKDLKMNTVHVLDLCRAMHYLSCNSKSGEIYNIVDKNCTDQGKLLKLAEDIFGIEYEFVGTPRSLMIKHDLNSLVDEMNEEHAEHWNAMCAHDKISNTPLSPYLHSHDLNSLVDEMNEEHAEHWNAMCAHDKISNTPLSPYLHSEQLEKKHLNLNGTKLEKMGFCYLVPTMLPEEVHNIMKEFVYRSNPLFPRSYIP